MAPHTNNTHRASPSLEGEATVAAAETEIPQFMTFMRDNVGGKKNMSKLKFSQQEPTESANLKP